MKRSIFISSFCVLLLLVFASCDSGGGGDGGASTPKTVLVLGDSISGEVNFSGVPPWPELLRADRPVWNIVNSSRGGDTSANGVSKISNEIARHNPSDVVIFYGSNDAIQGRQRNYENNLRTMVGAAKASGADVIIVTPPYMYESRSIFNGNIDFIVDAARRVASETGSRIANVNGETANAPELFPDGLHPNLDGQNICMVTIREKI